MDSKGKSVTPGIEEPLKGLAIGIEDYRDVIRALFQAGPKDKAARTATKLDAHGTPITLAAVERSFNGLTIVAEDRGSVYVVWVTKTREDGSLDEVLELAQFPLGPDPTLLKEKILPTPTST